MEEDLGRLGYEEDLDPRSAAIGDLLRFEFKIGREDADYVSEFPYPQSKEVASEILTRRGIDGHTVLENY